MLPAVPAKLADEIVPPCTASPPIYLGQRLVLMFFQDLCLYQEIEPPVIDALPVEKLVPESVVTATEPPVIDALFVVIVEKVPAAEVAAPITVPSIAPPSKSTTDEVKSAPEIAPPVI